ncbi:MAG: 50S ribosomal protein L15 [Bacilli bacterium]|nr:50S ribosomal protein L15 [Bacilli bacterium]
MKLESLPKTKELKNVKRVGRGPGSGIGKTSGHGENGQKSRSGASINAWFQGGQSPLYRRLPKRGFNNAQFETKYAVINLNDLDQFFEDGDVVTPEILKEKGIIKKQLAGVKVLATGKLTKKLTVKAHRFSSAAVTKIEESGGKTEVI